MRIPKLVRKHERNQPRVAIAAVDAAFVLKHFRNSGRDIRRQIQDPTLLYVTTPVVVRQVVFESSISRAEVTKSVPQCWIVTAAFVYPVQPSTSVNCEEAWRQTPKALQVGCNRELGQRTYRRLASSSKSCKS